MIWPRDASLVALDVAALRKQAGDLYVVAQRAINIAKVKIYS
jgi:hypothetical protein